MPGSAKEFFTLERYQQELGKDFKRITLFLLLKRSSDWQKVELLVIQNPTIICGTGIDLPDPFYPVEDKNNNPSNGNNDGDKVDVNMDVG